MVGIGVDADGTISPRRQLTAVLLSVLLVSAFVFLVPLAGLAASQGGGHVEGSGDCDHDRGHGNNPDGEDSDNPGNGDGVDDSSKNHDGEDGDCEREGDDGDNGSGDDGDNGSGDDGDSGDDGSDDGDDPGNQDPLDRLSRVRSTRRTAPPSSRSRRRGSADIRSSGR